MTLDPKALKPGAVVSLTAGQTIDETVIVHYVDSLEEVFPGGALLTFIDVAHRLPTMDPWVPSLESRPRDFYCFMTDAGNMVHASVAVVKKMNLEFA